MLQKEAQTQKNHEKTIAYISPLEEESLHLLEDTDALEAEMAAYYPRLAQEDLNDDARARAESYRRAAANLTKAASQVYAVKDELSARVLDLKKEKSPHPLLSAPANATIDLEERELHHFASGLNGYKLLLLCFIGSFAGVVIEMLWCLVKNGYLESRAGLIYGPFNPLYGVGAVVLTVALYRFRNRGAWISFVGGFLVGSVLEYVCSWGQEFVFGTRSWDYSNVPFNLNGRICLLYSLFWGLLGVLWIKNIYPRTVKWILKIPNKAGKIFTWCMSIFFIINILMSGLSLMRWTQRNEGIPPANAFWEAIDQHFPDERMANVYANMRFADSGQ